MSSTDTPRLEITRLVASMADDLGVSPAARESAIESVLAILDGMESPSQDLGHCVLGHYPNPCPPAVTLAFGHPACQACADEYSQASPRDEVAGSPASLRSRRYVALPAGASGDDEYPTAAAWHGITS